jgi:hypothetical protein
MQCKEVSIKQFVGKLEAKSVGDKSGELNELLNYSLFGVCDVTEGVGYVRNET